LNETIQTKKKGINALAAKFPSASSGQVWEHQIRDNGDYQKHMDYLYYNPVKHGLVEKVVDWPHSTFHSICSTRYLWNGLGRRE
jgi:REP element-mobilizing transposase RayT